MDMPASLQIVLWIAAGLGALSFLWLKGVRPVARFIAEADRAVPILRSVTDKLSDPNIIDVIVTMAKQFKTDSGSSLRDVVNRLEAASVESKTATDTLRISVEGGRQLQEGDRVQIARLLVLLDRLQLQADAAAGLAAGVASDLAESHARASEAGDDPGESADAFAVQPDKPEAGDMLKTSDEPTR